MPIIIEKGTATSVDWNKYDLTLDQAAKELFEGRDVIAREFEDYDDDYSFPDVTVLKAEVFKGESVKDIIEHIRCWYEMFGRTFDPVKVLNQL
jgi:hypothetical protein